MCEHCDDASISMLLDMLLRGLHLDVAQPLVRDMVTASALKIHGNRDAEFLAEQIRDVRDIVDHQAQMLRDLPTDDFVAMLEAR